MYEVLFGSLCGIYFSVSYYCHKWSNRVIFSNLSFLSPPNSTAVMFGFYGICVTKHSKLMEAQIVRRVENAFLWFLWVPGIHVPFVLFIFLMIFFVLWIQTIKLQSNVSMDLISINYTIKIQYRILQLIW